MIHFTYSIRKKVFSVMLLIIFLISGVFLCRHMNKKMALHDKLDQMEHFRAMEVGEDLIEEAKKLTGQSGISMGRILALAFTKKAGSFPEHLPEMDQLEKTAKWAYRWCPGEYELLQQAFCAVWDDVRCFPVKCRTDYEDSWMAERTYGGERGHEGTDLMPPVDQSGFYPVFSVTAGTVEKMGWVEKGGYRVGVRGGCDGYFYYAHLSGYAGNLSEGDEVDAGQLLGYMGDTGYGPQGTTGQFPVHLHFGIYIRTKEGQEISVNPYWILRSLEE